MTKIKKTTDGKKGGILYGKSHADGGIKAVVTDAGNKEVELEGGEAVVKKSALKDKTVKTLTGTNAQILNMINTRAGGNPIYAPSDVNMKNGGRVGGVDILSPYLENLKLNGIVLSDEDLVVLMYNEGKHKRSKGLYSPTILRKYLIGISEELANQLTIDLAMEFYDLFNEKDIPTYLKHNRIIIVNNTKVVFDNKKKMAEGGSVGEDVNEIELLKKAEKEYFDLNDFRVDENYDEDDVERNQRLVAIPKYRVSWESEYHSQEIGYYGSIDEAIKEADTNTDNQERDLESFNRVSLYFDVVWVDMDNYIHEEVEALVSLYDLENYKQYNLPDEIKNLDENIYTYTLEGTEDKSKELLLEVEDNLGDDISDEIEVEGYILKVEGHSGRKYSSINIIYNKDGEDFEIGSIKLRIADHAYNPHNNQFDSDFISVEVANENLTAERFHGSKSLQYDGDSDYDDIVSDVAERILEIVERWDIEEKINENTFEEGGNVGGAMLAPNGKPSNLTPEQYKLVRTPAFKAWFGDWEKLAMVKIKDSAMDEVTLANLSKDVSKVVDENGEPLVVYHGTPYGGFYEFDLNNIGKSTIPYWGKGIYLTASKFYAKGYAENKRTDSQQIYNLFAKCLNPYIVKRHLIGKDAYMKMVEENQYNDFNDFLIDNNYDSVIILDGESMKDAIEIMIHLSNQIKLADGTNTTFDSDSNDIRYKEGGNITPSAISKMTKAEQKAFYKTKEGKALDKATYTKWKSLVNMSKGELESFYNSKEGKEAGLSAKEAKAEGIDSGRESARWIMKMKDIPYTEWTSNMWIWAKKQISFVSRMKGMRGDLYDDKGNKTRKHLALLIWGHNPKKMAEGGNVGEVTFTDYKGEQIMFEPHNNEYFVIGNDENIFKSMEEAKHFIDNPNGAINTEFGKMAAAETKEVPNIDVTEIKNKINLLIGILDQKGLSESFEKLYNRLYVDSKSGILYNKVKLENEARKCGVESANDAKEVAEFTIVNLAREISLGEGSIKDKYDSIVELYKKQVNLSHRTSESIMYQQYSTPAPLGYLMGIYCNMNTKGKYFEPSAGNGLLTVSSNPQNFNVNEIDDVRNTNLSVQGFNKVTKVDASLPFIGLEKSFDAIITNPPFGTTETVMYGDSQIKSLEQVMALRALDTMKDNGRAAIIIGGHTLYDKEGRIQAGKNRTFFVYLYKNYYVEDVINIDGHNLYSRQGTAFNTRIILINGRKINPSGFPPLVKDKTPSTENHSLQMVSSFDDLYERVMKLK